MKISSLYRLIGLSRKLYGRVGGSCSAATSAASRGITGFSSPAFAPRWFDPAWIARSGAGAGQKPFLFATTIYRVELHLALHAVGVGKVDISGLVDALEGLRAQVSVLAACYRQPPDCNLSSSSRLAGIPVLQEGYVSSTPISRGFFSRPLSSPATA